MTDTRQWQAPTRLTCPWQRILSWAATASSDFIHCWLAHDSTASASVATTASFISVVMLMMMLEGCVPSFGHHCWLHCPLCHSEMWSVWVTCGQSLTDLWSVPVTCGQSHWPVVSLSDLSSVSLTCGQSEWPVVSLGDLWSVPVTCGQSHWPVVSLTDLWSVSLTCGQSHWPVVSLSDLSSVSLTCGQSVWPVVSLSDLWSVQVTCGHSGDSLWAGHLMHDVVCSLLNLSLFVSVCHYCFYMVLANTWSPEAPAAADIHWCVSPCLCMHSQHMGSPSYTCLSRCSALNALPPTEQAAWLALCLIWQKHPLQTLTAWSSVVNSVDCMLAVK